MKNTLFVYGKFSFVLAKNLIISIRFPHAKLLSMVFSHRNETCSIQIQ